MKKAKRFKTGKWFLLVFCCLVLLGVLSFFAIQIYIGQSAKKFIITADIAPACDAVMVLGALVYSDGTPSPLLADRLEYGYELYRSGKAKKILVSGDHGQPDYDEVKGMMDYLIQKGVPPEDIFLDHAGFNTYDSMYRARDIFGIKTLLISTQVFHMDRAVFIARKMGLEAYGYPCADKSSYRMSYLNTRESLARVKAFLDVNITKRQPKFLGDVIPINGDGTVTHDE